MCQNQQTTRSRSGLKTHNYSIEKHVNQIFELVLEQCVANYYRDNTIAE